MTYKPAQPARHMIDSPGNTNPALVLAATEEWAGPWEWDEAEGLPDVMVTVKPAGSGGTLYFQFSQDAGATVTSQFPVNGFDVADGINEFHTAVKGNRHFRVRYVNGAAPATLDLLTTYGAFPKAPNAPLSQALGTDSDAATVNAALVGEDSDTPGSFVSVQTTPDGALRTVTDSAIIDFAYDAFTKVAVDSVTDRFDYFVGGLAGTKVADVTIVYADDSKLDAISAERVKV